MASISVWVDGIPKGQPRPRAFHSGGKTRVYDPGTAEGWKAAVAVAVKPYLPPAPIDVPFAIGMSLHLPRPKRLMRRADPDNAIPAGCKPDCDNAAKAILDALTAVGLCRDDALCWRCDVEKRYASKGGKPGAFLTIYWEQP